MKPITIHPGSALAGAAIVVLTAVLSGHQIVGVPAVEVVRVVEPQEVQETIRAKKIVLVDDEGTMRLLLDGRLGRMWVYDPTGIFPAITLSGEKHLVGVSGPKGEIYAWLGRHGLGVHDSGGAPRIHLGVDPEEGAMMWIDTDGDREGRSLRE